MNTENSMQRTPAATHTVSVEALRGPVTAEWRRTESDLIEVIVNGRLVLAKAGKDDDANDAIAREVVRGWMEVSPPAAMLTEMELQRLEHFAWLVDNCGDDRSAGRLEVLWDWAGEMVHFQMMANLTGRPVEYFQRGKALRVLLPQTVQEAA